MSAGRPGAGVTVLLTHAEGALPELPDLLRPLGAVPEHRPAIAVGPPSDRAACRRVAAGIARYAWIVFTSANGARFFAAEHGGPTAGPRLAAVGPATARVLAELGMPPEVAAGDGRAETLAELLRSRVGPGDRVLVVRPEEARDVLAEALRAAGAEVEAVAFYRTAPAPGVEDTARRVAAGLYGAAVFASPSAVRALLAAGGEIPGFASALRALRRVAIGEITAEALRGAGFPPHAVPDLPGAAGIAEALRATMPPLSGTPRPEDA